MNENLIIILIIALMILTTQLGPATVLVLITCFIVARFLIDTFIE